MTLKTVIVAVSGGAFVVVFKQGDDIARTESYQLWKDATRAMLAWVGC